MNLKNIIIMIFLFFLSLRLIAQIDFSEKLYNKLIFENIEIRDSNNLLIHKDKYLGIFYRIDSVIICFPDDKAVLYNNGLNLAFTSYIFDTISNIYDNKRLDFFKINTDDLGNFIDKRFVFYLDKKVIDNWNTIKQYDLRPNKLSNKGNNSWVIEDFILRDKSITIDDCLKSYYIQFDCSGIFHQNYEKKEHNCATFFDLLTMITQQSPIYYSEKSDNNHFEINNGYWKTDNNIIILLSSNAEQMCFIGYLFENNNLILYNNYWKMTLMEKE